MNKKTLAVVLVLFLLISAGIVYLVTRPNKSTESVPAPQPPVSTQPEESAIEKGKYVEYTEESFAQTKGTRLLFFYAPWCPQCRALDESIKATNLPAGVTIFKLDYDSTQSLRQKYGVTLQTTVVKVDVEGAGVKNYVAYDQPNFDAVSRALLP